MFTELLASLSTDTNLGFWREIHVWNTTTIVIVIVIVIVIATGEERGLERVEADYPVGISDPACPVKFVITQKALAEGRDCPFAYILVNMAALHSATAVEQLLGRVPRQPDVRHRHNQPLNQPYTFVVSRHFAETASALRDRLVAGAGFERREVADFVAAARAEQNRFDLFSVRPVTVALAEKPDLKGVPKTVRDKVTWDGQCNTLTINALLTEDETEKSSRHRSRPRRRRPLSSKQPKSAAPPPANSSKSRRNGASGFAFRNWRCAYRANCGYSTTRKSWNTHGICRPATPRRPPMIGCCWARVSPCPKVARLMWTTPAN